MRTIQHWWRNQRDYTSYGLSLYLHWFGFTVNVTWGTSNGTIMVALREKAPGRYAPPQEVYPPNE